jgi:actin-related protein
MIKSKLFDPTESSLIYGESPFSSFNDRTTNFELLFETYQFQKVCPLLEEAALLHSHISQTSPKKREFTGLVVNMKDMHVSVLPIVKGYVLPQGMYCHPFGHTHLISFIHNRIVSLNPETPFLENMTLTPSSQLTWPYPFLNFKNVNKKLFRLCSKMLKKYCKVLTQKDPDLERKILASAPKNIELDQKLLKLDVPSLHIYEVFFSPELFDLPEEYNLIKGILDSLANLHSDLKKKVLQVVSYPTGCNV